MHTKSLHTVRKVSVTHCQLILFTPNKRWPTRYEVFFFAMRFIRNDITRLKSGRRIGGTLMFSSTGAWIARERRYVAAGMVIDHMIECIPSASSKVSLEVFELIYFTILTS